MLELPAIAHHQYSGRGTKAQREMVALGVGFRYMRGMGAAISNDRLQQTQLAGTSDCFGAILDLQFVENDPIVPFDRIHGEEEPVADFLIRETLGDEPQHF